MSQYLPYCAGFIFGGYMKSLLFGCPVTANVFFELELKNRKLSNQDTNTPESSNLDPHTPELPDQDTKTPRGADSEGTIGVSPTQYKSKIYRIYLTLVPEIIGAIALGLIGSRFLGCFQS